MPRTGTTLSQLVARFYLKAPLAEIEGIQPYLREIYEHRKGQADRSKAARVAQAAPAEADAAPAAPAPKRRRKPGPKKGSKKAKAAAGAVEVAPFAGEAAFGGKQAVEDAGAPA